MCMNRVDFDRITAVDSAGNNPDQRKAAQMRFFVIPPDLMEVGSREPHNERGMTILFAVICKDRVFLLTDHSRIARIHVISLGRHWVADDLEPGSEVRFQLL